MSSQVRVANLTRHFRGADAPSIAGLDLEIQAGTCVAIVGPSGCGKSSLLRIIAGLDVADGGRVELDGEIVNGIPPEQRRVALAFQQPRLFPHMSVVDNVAFGLEASGLDRSEARIQAVPYLALVGMEDFAHRRPTTLSGGQEQRVALARALAARPRLLLLDEPFSALDPATRTQMHALLARLRTSLAVTVILVTHDRDEAAAVGDRVGVMLDGQIAQLGSLAELYARPVSLAVHQFLGGTNEILGTVVGDSHRSPLGTLELPTSGAHAPGAGTLLCRPESLEITSARSKRAHVTGTVAEISPQGARRRVNVQVEAAVLSVDAAPHRSLEVGDTVGVMIPLASRHVVAVDGKRAGELP